MKVLDSSALLAALLDEPGGEQVYREFDQACISTVNLAEVAGRLTKAGKSADEARRILIDLRLPSFSPDADVAMDAGFLRGLTEAAGLSLGDRFCLALARRILASGLTADRNRERIADLVGVEVQLIR